MELGPRIEERRLRLRLRDEGDEQRRRDLVRRLGLVPLSFVASHVCLRVLEVRVGLLLLGGPLHRVPAGALTLARVTQRLQGAGRLLVEGANLRRQLRDHRALHRVARRPLKEAPLRLGEHERAESLKGGRPHVEGEALVRRPPRARCSADGGVEAARRVLEVLAGSAQAVGVRRVLDGGSVGEGGREVEHGTGALKTELGERALRLGAERVVPREG
mmetsp:Transcript_37510/g.121222  ORF Transcript_37510/g.121222 Transcript_37510/m.121222 type:complete len:217 (-) Transcript_37510:344-994(-)